MARPANVLLLGLGTAPGGTGLKDEEAIRLFNRAIDLGVTYVDTAPMYGRAQRQLSEIVPERREEMFLVSKALTEDGAEAQRILEDNLRELKTDYLDLMFVHSVGSHDVGKAFPYWFIGRSALSQAAGTCSTYWRHGPQ